MGKQKTPACDRGSMNKALDSFNSIQVRAKNSGLSGSKWWWAWWLCAQA